MKERTLRAFARRPRWQRATIAMLATLIVLWVAWGVILVLFAFALRIGVIAAALASVWILFSLRKFLVAASRYR
jgi:hypothetical protein